MKQPKRLEALIDRRIEESYRRNCAGAQIDMMDIGKVFAAGRRAIAAGADLDSALREFVESIRKN